MSSWKTSVIREPTGAECRDIARGYLDAVALSLPEERKAFIANVVSWNAIKSAHAGDLDWPDDVYEWDCPEYSQYLASTSVVPEVPAFQLTLLASVRLRAWVVMSLSAFGPAGRVSQRTSEDRARARERHQAVQNLDFEAFCEELAHAFRLELGDNWRRQKAATRLFRHLTEKQAKYKAWTEEDFYKEASSFLPDMFTLDVYACTHCTQRGKIAGNIPPNIEELPPFDFSCRCEVGWKHEWDIKKSPEDKPNLGASVQNWVRYSVDNFSVRAPTLREMIAFEEARSQDENMMDNLSSKIAQILKKSRN